MIKTPTLAEVVKMKRYANMSFLRQGYVYYTVVVDDNTWVFPIEIADLGGATVNATEKTITLMRYIRKALDNEMFVLST